MVKAKVKMMDGQGRNRTTDTPIFSPGFETA
jgi:hypothetical protein